MSRSIVRLLVFGLLLAGVGQAAAELCARCEGRFYIASAGQCVVCRGWTGSGAFQLCTRCSERLNQCENCRAPLRDDSGLIVLLERDNGNTVSTTVGENVIVRLRGNITTGYRWLALPVEGNALVLVGKVEYVPDPVKLGIVGSGGTFVATYRAARRGTAVLRLQLEPPGRTMGPTQLFQATVMVGTVRAVPY